MRCFEFHFHHCRKRDGFYYFYMFDVLARLCSFVLIPSMILYSIFRMLFRSFKQYLSLSLTQTHCCFSDYRIVLFLVLNVVLFFLLSVCEHKTPFHIRDYFYTVKQEICEIHCCPLLSFTSFHSLFVCFYIWYSFFSFSFSYLVHVFYFNTNKKKQKIHILGTWQNDYIAPNMHIIQSNRFRCFIARVLCFLAIFFVRCCCNST